MGAASSHDDSTSEMSDVIGREYGFRVHRVEPGSPGEAAGLTSILDYIVVANGVRLDHDDGTFVRMITESKGAPMKLCVFNTHTLTTRETMLTPNDEWGGNGLLGITIRFDGIRSPHNLQCAWAVHEYDFALCELLSRICSDAASIRLLLSDTRPIEAHSACPRRF